MILRRKQKLKYEVPPLEGFAVMADTFARMGGRRSYVAWKLACQASLRASQARRRRR